MLIVKRDSRQSSLIRFGKKAKGNVICWRRCVLEIFVEVGAAIMYTNSIWLVVYMFHMRSVSREIRSLEVLQTFGLFLQLLEACHLLFCVTLAEQWRVTSAVGRLGIASLSAVCCEQNNLH